MLSAGFGGRLALLAQLAFAASLLSAANAVVVNTSPNRTEYAVRLANLQASTTANGSYIAVAPVYGNADCDFSAAITYGSNTFLVTLDTGSSNNAIASSTCSSCGFTTGYPGNPSASNQFTTSYGTASQPSSWTGYLSVIETTVTGLGNLTERTLASDVAIILSQTNFFDSTCTGYTEGILGLGYEAISQHGSVSFADFLANNNVPDGFALELCSEAYPASATQRTGNWWIGGYPSSHLKVPMVFTPIIEKAWYGVSLVGLTLGGTALSVQQLSSPRAIVDSGTSGLVLASDNYAVVVAAMQSQGAVAFDSNFVSADIQNKFWTGYTITLSSTYVTFSSTAVLYLQLLNMDQTGTVSVPIYPKEYIEVYGPDTNGKISLTLLVFSSGTTSGSGSVSTIIGLPSHLGKVVYYDRGPNSRIGFAETTVCASITSSGIATPSISEMDVIAPLNTYSLNGAEASGRTLQSFALTFACASAAIAWILS